jgi:hypothetical protein
MGLIDATICTNAAKSARIITIPTTPKPFRIRTYKRGFKSMKTFDFNPTRMRTYDDRACNPSIIRTYEKHGERGSNCFKIVQR